MSSSVDVAVIPVAGLGTRWLPVTRSVPKELLPVWKQSAVSYAVAEAQRAGAREIVFIIAPGKGEVAEHFREDADLVQMLEGRGKRGLLGGLPDLWATIEVKTAVQAEPLGLGHAVLCARDEVAGRPFFLLLPDEVLLSDAGACADLSAATDADGSSILLMDVAREETYRYGIADPAGDAGEVAVKLRGLVEKPRPEDAPSTLAAVGRYLLQPAVFDILAQTGAGHGGEIQLTDALAVMAKRGELTGVRFGGERHDVGQPFGLLVASVAMGLADPVNGDAVRDALRELLER